MFFNLMNYFLLFLAGVVVSDQWTSFKLQYNRFYSSANEESYRKSCFIQNLQLIERKNAESNGVTYGITKFADLCPGERKRQRFNPHLRSGQAAKVFSRSEVNKAKTESFDWRKKGAVTNVKDEGQCGSTWAFSAAENMEGQWFLAGHGLYNLSVQELVSCDTNSHGCLGGLMTYGQEYAVKHGITSADIYPYTSGSGDSGKCELDKVKRPVARFSSVIDNFQDEDQMLTWTSKNGPLSVGIDASELDLYKGGIISSCPDEPDHAILLVGYGYEPNGTSYWIAKNQWGTDWGENGYLRLLYGHNMCNLTSYPSSALV